jgi:hypothetical protein
VSFSVAAWPAIPNNAGQIYFPSGCLEPNEIVRSNINLAAAWRELAEETALRAEEGFNRSLARHLGGCRFAVVKIALARYSAEVLAERIRANLASQEQPEFAAIRVVCSLADMDKQMPPRVPAFFARA